MSNNSSNKLNVPQARQAMDQFKMLTRQRGRRQPQERLQRRPRQGPDGQEDMSRTKHEIRTAEPNRSGPLSEGGVHSLDDRIVASYL